MSWHCGRSSTAIKKTYGPKSRAMLAAELLWGQLKLLMRRPKQVRALASCKDGFWTGSRDKTCKLWSPHDKGFNASTTLVSCASGKLQFLHADISRPVQLFPMHGAPAAWLSSCASLEQARVHAAPQRSFVCTSPSMLAD